eukprot:s3641_g13.t1
MSALTEVVESFVKFARDFGQCMIEEVVEPYLEDEYGCRFSASPQQMTASLTCTQLVLSVVASIDFKPKASIDIDTTASTATISLEGDVTGTAGVGALAGGSCTYERELFFPSAPPKPVATYCLYAVCVTVLIQGSVKLDYHTVYSVGGQTTLELSSENLDQSANAAIADRVSDHWSLNAVGSMSAAISVTVGPVVTILVVLGTFASLHPFVMAQASLFGTMKFEKASAGEGNDKFWQRHQRTSYRPPRHRRAVLRRRGVRATALGPPPGFQDLTQVVSAVRSELTDSLTKFSLGSTAALGAVNCVGRWITGDENFDMVVAWIRQCSRPASHGAG